MDLKELFEEWEHFEEPVGEYNRELGDYMVDKIKESLGLFFWEQYKENRNYQLELKNKKDKYSQKWCYAHHCMKVRMHQFALACLGEQKVKELIKELGREGVEK